MDFLKSRIEFHRWLDQCISDAQSENKLDLNMADIIILLSEKLKELVVAEYCQRIRK